jgi:hypothetical protein
MVNMYKCNHLLNLLTVYLVSLVLYLLEETPRKQVIDHDHDAKDDVRDNNGDEDDDDFRMDLALRKTSFNAVGNDSAKPSLPDRSTSMVSEGGWSDDDSNTIKSDYTDKSWGTIGSAIVVDATITSKEDATKHLSKMAAAQINQKDENARQQDIVFTPPSNENQTGENDEEEDAQISNSFKNKNKNKKKSKGSKENNIDSRYNEIDIYDDGNKGSKKKKKRHSKKFEDDIIFEYNANDTKKISSTVIMDEDEDGCFGNGDEGDDVKDAVDDTITPSKKNSSKKKNKKKKQN